MSLLAMVASARPVRSLSSLSSRLKNPSLLSIVDASSSLPTYEVRNPADPNSILAKVRIMNQDDARACIDRSRDRLKDWRDGTTAVYRSNLLREWSRLIDENTHDIATIMTLESGKPLRESISEVAYARSFLEYYAAEAVRPTCTGGGFMVPTPFSTESGAPRGQIMAIQQAAGVVALITPWNFPAAMVRKVCKVVVIFLLPADVS
jgi:succinate-semialdehyde dehydrogenase/glutarate-semialdehyde dehydrogenase